MLATNHHFTVTGADTSEVRNRWWDFLFFIIGVIVVVVSLFMLVKKYNANKGFQWTDIKYIVFTILAVNAGVQFYQKQQLAQKILFQINGTQLLYVDVLTKTQHSILLTDIQQIRLTYDEILLVTLDSHAKHEIATQQWPAAKKAELQQWLKTQETDVA